MLSNIGAPERAAAGGERHFAPVGRAGNALELLAAARMTQLTQRLGLDLTDALASDLEVLADFFQRVVALLADAAVMLPRSGEAR
jgi:hypothetical protein